MTQPTNEQCYAALFALLTTSPAAPAWQTVGRKAKMWKDVPPAGQPALFQMEPGENYMPRPRGMPQQVTLFASLMIYIPTNDPGVVPATLLNNVLQSINNSLLPTDMITGAQTLGGLVSHCWIEGRIIKDPGDLDGQGILVIPVRMLIP